MKGDRLKAPQGFTLVEVMLSTVIMMIVMLGIGAVIVDGQSSWNAMYGRLHSDVVTDGYVARKKFESVVREASDERFVLGSGGSWIEIYSYADDSSIVVDRYARLGVADGNLNYEYGQLNPREALRVETLCTNVSECTFELVGRSIQMILTLDNGTHTNTIVSSAVAQNQ